MARHKETLHLLREDDMSLRGVRQRRTTKQSNAKHCPERSEGSPAELKGDPSSKTRDDTSHWIASPSARNDILQKKISSCKKCPRLAKYIASIKEKYPTYWCKPVPSFGDVNAEILIVGLAPGRFGSNRTGRMFTGDASGEFLYGTLFDVGLCNKPTSTNVNDGLILKNCYITAVGRCAPPQNKPTPKELENCFPYFAEEIKLLKNVKVVVALGKIAFDGYLKWLTRHCEEGRSPDEAISLRETVRRLLRRPPRRTPRNDVLRKKDFKFSHGAIYTSKNLPHVLIASYHPSRQNTQTGRLTKKMFKQIFKKALQYCSK